MSAPATETRKAKSRLAVLSSSIDELEEYLQPLLSQTLPETLLGLEPLQQAKLLTDIPYVVYDLAFIYLKSRGVDPKTHPVISELERVKTYFDKIKNAENPPQRTTQVDKAAASRFIQHAISQATSNLNAPSTSTPGASTSSSSAPVPIKVTSKMRERAEYERQLKEGKDEEEEEDDLQVFEDTAVPKRKRPAVDHFAGVGEEEPEAPSPATEVIKKQKLNPSASSTPVVSSPAPSDGPSKPEKKKKKTKPKKKKKGAEDGEDN
ncbi:hypothetical protein PM082_003455 [Marasmius tenuissimus]|nr:hypothetical protein PM082_003455 [Marasmius tenuissimus]